MECCFRKNVDDNATLVNSIIILAFLKKVWYTIIIFNESEVSVLIYITGDIHGDLDIHKLTSEIFTEGLDLTREDYVIICGDFGLRWDDSPEELHWLEWLDNKPWTTLWIDGNHENFYMLEEYDFEEWHGGKVQFITPNIIHLCRGEMFDIDGLKFYCFGGAESHDKEFRRVGISIWREEVPSPEEIEHGRQTLEENGWKADIVITHSMPDHIQNEVFKPGTYASNILTQFLDEVDEKLEYKLWFSGHYHFSKTFDNRHFFIYNDIVKLTDEGFERVVPKKARTKYIDVLPEIFPEPDEEETEALPDDADAPEEAECAAGENTAEPNIPYTNEAE